MIRINLLPVRESRRLEAVKRELILGALVLVVLLVLCGGVFLFMQKKISDVRDENASIQADIDNLRTVVARVDEIDQLKEELKKKLQVIRQLKRNKVGPVYMMDELADATPEKLTLNSLKEQNRRLTIQGYAVSNEVISQFLSTLEQSDWFQDVYLIEIDQNEQDGYKIKEFSVTAQLVIEQVGEEEGAEGEEEEASKGKGKRGKGKRGKN